MPTISEQLRERVIDWALGPEKRKLQEGMAILLESQRYALTPESLLQQLSEVDSQLLDLFIRQRGYDTIFGQGLSRRSQVTEQQRLTAVDDARYMYHRDVMISRSVKVLTDFGFGQRVQITPRDKALAQRWADFWEAPANDYVLNEREIGQLSTDQVTDGEFFMVFFISKLDGTCTVRVLTTDRIIRIETAPNDPKVPIYYVENTLSGEIWYPDWRSTEAQRDRVPLKTGAKLIDDLGQETTAQVLHVAFEKLNGRGWPMINRALDWARAYKNFLQDRATVARAVATYVDKLTAKGGSRVGAALMGQLNSSLATSFSRGERNPAPAAGSTWFQNEALDRERMPLSTGAGDAQTDGMTIAAQVSSGTGTPLHYLNRPDAMQNRAVARESGQPFIKQVQRYQTFWSSIFADMVRIVARAWETYDRMHPQIADHSADILLDSPFEADIAELAQIMGAVTTAAGSSQLDQDVAQRINEKLAELALTALGVREPQNILRPANATSTRGNDASPDAVRQATENWLAGRIPDQVFAEFMRGALDDADICSLRSTALPPTCRSCAPRFVDFWTGALTRDQFIDAMDSTVRRGLSRAFEQGADTWGIKPDELDDEEIGVRDQIIDAEGGYVRSLADDIEAGSKANGGKLDTFFYRADLWAAKYDQVKQRAKILTGENQKLEWVYDPKKEHCPDCLKLNGKVKRAKDWDAAGLFPKSRRLKCRGYYCGCDLEPTTKGITKGRLPQPTYASELMAPAVQAELVKLVALGTPVEMAMQMAYDSVLDGLDLGLRDRGGRQAAGV